MKDFDQFYNRNQRGSDCCIVTALNASLYLNKKKLIKPGTKAYNTILKKTGCQHGSAINPDQCYPKLKIDTKKRYKRWYDVNFKDLPLEITLWHSHYGFHSACVIDYSEKDKAVQVLNFKRETTTDGWIFLQALKHYEGNTNTNTGWVARSFKKLWVKR